MTEYVNAHRLISVENWCHRKQIDHIPSTEAALKEHINPFHSNGFFLEYQYIKYRIVHFCFNVAATNDM